MDPSKLAYIGHDRSQTLRQRQSTSGQRHAPARTATCIDTSTPTADTFQKQKPYRHQAAQLLFFWKSANTHAKRTLYTPQRQSSPTDVRKLQRRRNSAEMRSWPYHTPNGSARSTKHAKLVTHRHATKEQRKAETNSPLMEGGIDAPQT